MKSKHKLKAIILMLYDEIHQSAIQIRSSRYKIIENA